MRTRAVLVGSTLVLVSGCTGGSTSVEASTGGEGDGPAAISIEPGSFEVDPSAAGLDAVVDAEGVLHLVWWEGASIAGATLTSRSVAVGGELGPPEPVAGGFEIVEADPELLLDPDGQVCVALEGWPDAGDISSEGLYRSCRVSGSWSEPELVEQQGVTADYATALDGSGALVSIHVSPPSSIAFGDLELGDGSTVQNPAFVIDRGGAYHATWQSLGSPGGLIYRSSTDGGASWSGPETLSDDEFFTKPTSLAVAPDGTVHVFFASSDLFHRSGTVGAFGPLETVAVGIGNVPSTGTVTDDGDARALWTDAAGVRHASSSGDTWSAPVLVPGTEGAVADELAAAVAPDGTVVVAWIEPGEPLAVRYAIVRAG